MTARRVFMILCAVLTVFCAYPATLTDTSTKVFDVAVRSLKISNSADFYAPPVIVPELGERIVISFDILGDDRDYLRYRLVHCNADWQPSRLLETEYLDGFNESNIDDYAFSSNTFVHYVNYRLELPSEDTGFRTSGNYLLLVYREDDPDDVILQGRFSVSEGSALVGIRADGHTDNGVNDCWQQASVSVNTFDREVRNPYQDLVVTLTQNGCDKMQREITHPMRVDGPETIFEHQRELIFPAGNEFRRFETVRTDYPGMHVDSTRFDGSVWHAWLSADEPRAERNYEYDRTQQGRFKIDEYNSTDPDLGADYVTVHFTLRMPQLPGGEVYVDGEFSHHSGVAAYRMRYDHDRMCYTLSLPLKQGSYNYRYVGRPAGKPDSPEDYSVIEGDKYETANEYVAKVFLRQPGSRGDRLIGMGRTLSVP